MYTRICVQITMASISVVWVWPSQTHLIGWNINARLESSASLNSWAYVCAYAHICARKNVCQKYEQCSTCARTRAYTRVETVSKYEFTFDCNNSKHTNQCANFLSSDHKYNISNQSDWWKQGGCHIVCLKTWHLLLLLNNHPSKIFNI